MALECLLLTGDSALLCTIRAKFSEQGIELLVRKDAASAIEFSKRRHLDGFVIDCDDVPQGKEALRSIPANSANKRSVMLAIVNGRTSVSEAFEMGANFVLGKPIQDGRICAVMDMADNKRSEIDYQKTHTTHRNLFTKKLKYNHAQKEVTRRRNSLPHFSVITNF